MRQSPKMLVIPRPCTCNLLKKKTGKKKRKVFAIEERGIFRALAIEN